jgi:hypothetical protein
MALSDYLPSHDTLKYDLNIIGAVLLALPAYYGQLPILGPRSQQVITLLATIYAIGAGVARPAGAK